MASEYRDLIQQVQDKGGPLQIADGDSLPVGDMEKDILAGVLRRDIVARGCNVSLHHYAWDATTTNGKAYEVDINVWPPRYDFVPRQGHTQLETMLLAWLDAAEKLGWEQEGAT